MRRLLAPSVIAVLLLAGCSASPTPTASSAEPSVTPSPIYTPSETPSPSPTAVALDCPTWTDDPDSTAAAIGPISFAGVCVGQSFDDATAQGASLTIVDACPWYADLVEVDDPGLYVSAITDPASPGDSIMFFVLKWFADPADAASYEMPATAEGITIGSSAADVLAAYPDATEVSFDDISRGPRKQLVAPTSDTTSYNFDIADGVVTEISWGTGLSEGGPNGELCAL